MFDPCQTEREIENERACVFAFEREKFIETEREREGERK
jgi:hypothetical protein